MKKEIFGNSKKKFIFSLIIALFLVGGIFYFVSAKIVNLDLLKASVGSLLSFNKKADNLQLLLNQAQLEINRLQKENQSLKESLAQENGERNNLELKYKSELASLAEQVTVLTQMVDDFSIKMKELTKEEKEKDEKEEEEQKEEENQEVCRVNLNTASAKELEKLTGIGPTLAQRIIAVRPFSSVYELIKVKGIGETTLQKIIDQGCAYVENDTGSSPIIYSSGSSGGSSGSSSTSGSSSSKIEGCAANSIEINTASLEDLDKLEGVGPKTAQKIIDSRPYYSVDDLIKVSGIGTATLEDIKNQGCAYVDASLLPPIAQFTFAPSNPVVNEEIVFDASSSTSSTGQIVSYLWDFGDGTATSTNSATTSYSFSEVGQYLVTLLVVNEKNNTSSAATTTINVQAIPEEATSSVNLLLNPYFDDGWEGTATAGNPINWIWGKRGGLALEDSPLIPGRQSFYHEPYSDYVDLVQIGKTLEVGKTYYAEIWIKGTGKVKLGIDHSATTTWLSSQYNEFNNAAWTKMTYSITPTIYSNNGGIRIRMTRLSSTGERLVVGAAWLSSTEPPEGWPFNATP